MLTYILVLLLLIVLTLLLLWYVARVARKRAAAATGPAGAAESSLHRSLSSLRWSFRSSVALIEANLASRWRRYRIPWILLLGDTGSGKSTLMENAGLDRAFSPNSGSAVQHVGVGWNYFNRGVVLDVAGEYLGAVRGADGGDRAWQTLLHLAEKYRPERPIDGIVVTVSAAEFVGAERSGMEDLVHKADLMHKRLWQAQSRFGIRFPVYIVITQCDRIAGFSSFVRSLPEQLRGGMLGWANPYDFEAGYQSDWAEQGVSGIAQSIFELQAEILAAGRSVEDADAFALFPSAFAATRDALRVYLDQLFRPSAYHETFLFRGIFLTGDGGPAARGESGFFAAEPAPNPAIEPIGGSEAPAMLSLAPGREPVFVKDLFERKVFAEFGLARPSREARASRNRTVRILRWSTAVLALVWMSTLGLAAVQLDAKVDAYERALDVMVSARKERQTAHVRNEHLPVDWYLRKTTALLERMAPLGGVRLWWFSIPGSWPSFTSLHDQIQATLYGGFQDIIFNVVRKGLNVKVSDLTSAQRHEVTTELIGDFTDCGRERAREPGAPPPPTLAIEDLPEFPKLVEQVQNFATLEANLGTFDRLRKGESEVPDLRALLRYTWRIELPESLDKGGYHTLAMRQGYQFKERNPGDIFAKTAACAFNRRLDQIYGRFFAQNQLLLLSRDIAGRLSRLSESAGREQQEDEPYAQLLMQIQALDALLKSPRSRWIQAGERDLGPAYEELLQHVSQVSALGPRLREDARASAQAEIERLRKDLAPPAAEAVGPILRRSAEGAWALAPEVSGLQASLAVLLKQRFMVDAEGRKLDTRVEPGTVVRWDIKRLDEAIALADEQRRYLKDGLGKFPPLLQPDVQDIANRHLARRLTDLVAKAESIAPDSSASRPGVAGAEASADVHDLDRAGPQLVRLLAIMKDIGAESAYDDLSGLMRRDAVRGLLALNRALDGNELYTVRDGNFSWWQGSKNPAAGAFRASDPQALADYLGQQYNQAEWLAKLSAPLLAVTDSSGMRLDSDTTRIVRRLRAMNREVERFKAKNPKSSVAELEGFIRTEMAEVDGQNCVEKLGPKIGTARDPDFFLERQITLRQQLYTRCVDLVIAEASKAYGVIEASFGRTLAGRFPFGQQPERGTAGEAELEDVVQFLRLYDRHGKSALPLLSIPMSGASADARRFLEQMERVKAFLGPLVPPDDGAPAAGYDLGVEFRVNQRAEVDGNKIVDWSLEVADQTVRLRDANRQIRWRVGMPIVMTLRWAKDASSAPVNDGAQAHLTVDGKNVVYRYTDPWALVSMLKMHAAGPVDAVSRAEVRPHTLKFEFATQPIPAAGQYRSNLPEARARVFIRLGVSPSGKKDVLTLPVFPAQSPGLSPEQAYGPQRQGARTGWPDIHSGMRVQPALAPKPAAKRAGGNAVD